MIMMRFFLPLPTSRLNVARAVVAAGLGTALIASCGVDQAGLGTMPFLPHDASSADTSPAGVAGASGNPGVAGASGTGGSTSGVAGTGGGGVAGTGGSGVAGVAGTGGNPAGAAGTSGDAGTSGAAGAGGVAGTGGDGAAGTGGSGAAGVAGTVGTGGDAAAAPRAPAAIAPASAGTGGATAGSAGTGGIAGTTGVAGTSGGTGGRGGSGGTGGAGNLHAPELRRRVLQGSSGVCIRARTATQCGGQGPVVRAVRRLPDPARATGQCRIDTASRWKIVAVAAKLDTGNNWDRFSGDLGGSAPDPFCEFENPAGQVSSTTAGVTDTLIDTYNPTWNQEITPPGDDRVGGDADGEQPHLADLGRRRRQLQPGIGCFGEVACTIRQTITETQLRSGQLIVNNRQQLRFGDDRLRLPGRRWRVNSPVARAAGAGRGRQSRQEVVRPWRPDRCAGSGCRRACDRGRRSQAWCAPGAG